MGSSKIFVALTIVLVSLWIWAACRPKAVKDMPVTGAPDTTKLEAQVDSSNQIRQDGLDYAPLNTGTYQTLPPLLDSLLSFKYPGWSFPPISQKYLKQLPRNATGPYFIQADFDQNTLEDYALQFRYHDSTWVVAYLIYPHQHPQEYIISTFAAGNTDTAGNERFMISLLRPGKEIYAEPVRQKIKLLQPALAVDSSFHSNLYVFKNKAFNRYRFQYK